MEIGKTHFLMINEKCYKKKNASLKTWILQLQTTAEKTELIVYLMLGEIKLCNLKNVHFKKKTQKVKKVAILHSMTTLKNVALKIEIGFELHEYLTFKAIIKTRNVNHKC